MKHTIGLIALLTLAACNTSESSKSKSCTYNDEPIDCSILENSRSDSSTANQNLRLKAEVSSEIRISNNTIEILENTHNFQKETLNGKSYECESSTSSSEIYNYHVSGDKLQLYKNGVSEFYQRVNGVKNKLQGSWEATIKDKASSTVINLTISEEKMIVTVNCQF